MRKSLSRLHATSQTNANGHSREVENVLNLYAVRSSAIYPLLADQTQLTLMSLDILRLRTIVRLSKFRPKSPLLTKDLEKLHISGYRET